MLASGSRLKSPGPPKLWAFIIVTTFHPTSDSPDWHWIYSCMSGFCVLVLQWVGFALFPVHYFIYCNQTGHHIHAVHSVSSFHHNIISLRSLCNEHAVWWFSLFCSQSFCFIWCLIHHGLPFNIILWGSEWRWLFFNVRKDIKCTLACLLCPRTWSKSIMSY